MAEVAHNHRCVVCNHQCVPHCECPDFNAVRNCANEPPGMRSKHCLDLGIRKERERMDAEAAKGAEEWHRKVEEAKDKV
jgi:hypothetical protein